MAECIIFESGKGKKFTGDFFKDESLLWIHFNKKDENIISDLKKLINEETFMIEDFLEEQRPNSVSFEKFSVAVFTFPYENLKTLQITFILLRKKIITISNFENNNINSILQKITMEKNITGVTNIFSFILDKMIESSIKKLDKMEDDLEKKEKIAISGNNNKNFIYDNNDLRDKLYYTIKNMKGNLEVVEDILSNKVNFLNLKYFGEHMQDRFLYLLDFCESLREYITTLNNEYISMISFETNNRIYKLTIIGSLLILPTIVSGFFGMNVELPNLSFMQIIGATFGLSIILYSILKLRF
jgi:magnesium transporter